MRLLLRELLLKLVLQIGQGSEIHAVGEKNLSCLSASFSVAAMIAAVVPSDRPHLEQCLFQPLDLAFGDGEVKGGAGQGLVNDRAVSFAPVDVPCEAHVVIEKFDHTGGEARAFSQRV